MNMKWLISCKFVSIKFKGCNQYTTKTKFHLLCSHRVLNYDFIVLSAYAFLRS